MILKQNQSAFDLATQSSGDARSVVLFCLLNGFGVTQDLPAGLDVLEPENSLYGDLDVKEYFETKEYELTTGTPITETLVLGIGTMIIESNFDVD